MCKCLICGNIFKSSDPMGPHLKRKHNITMKEYYDKYFKKDKEGICPVCGKNTPFINQVLGYQKHCCSKCAGQDEKVLKRRIRTCRRKYGTDSVCSNGCVVRENMNKDYLERTGYKSPLNNPDVIKLREENYIKKHGVKNPMQNHEVFKESKKKYLYNDIHFSSGWELVYYIWLKDNNIEFEYQPKPLYYEFEGKKHPYFPDFKVKNKFIEIKSDGLFKCMLTENTQENAKYKCMLENNVEIMKFEEMKPYIEYIENKTKLKYSKFIKQYKNY